MNVTTSFLDSNSDAVIPEPDAVIRSAAAELLQMWHGTKVRHGFKQEDGVTNLLPNSIVRELSHVT